MSSMCCWAQQFTSMNLGNRIAHAVGRDLRWQEMWICCCAEQAQTDHVPGRQTCVQNGILEYRGMANVHTHNVRFDAAIWGGATARKVLVRGRNRMECRTKQVGRDSGFRRGRRYCPLCNNPAGHIRETPATTSSPRPRMTNLVSRFNEKLRGDIPPSI